jgi:hypothetical protein
MNTESVVRFIGLSHLLQPPLALLLTRRLELARALAVCPPLVAQVGRNMAIASIALPTALGLLLALHAHDVGAGPARSLAWLVSAFWSWRLIQQWRAAGIWGARNGAGRLFHWCLSTIFVVQGPGLALCLLQPPFSGLFGKP